MFVVPIPTPILVVTTSSHTRWAKLSKAESHKAVERAHKHVIFSDFVDFFLNVMGDDVNGWKFGEPENVLDDLELWDLLERTVRCVWPRDRPQRRSTFVHNRVPWLRLRQRVQFHVVFEVSLMRARTVG